MGEAGSPCRWTCCFVKRPNILHSLSIIFQFGRSLSMSKVRQVFTPFHKQISNFMWSNKGLPLKRNSEYWIQGIVKHRHYASIPTPYTIQRSNMYHPRALNSSMQTYKHIMEQIQNGATTSFTVFWLHIQNNIHPLKSRGKLQIKIKNSTF